MALGDDHRPAHAIGLEAMKRPPLDSCTDALGGGEHALFDPGDIVEAVAATIIEFSNDMASDGLHGPSISRCGV